MAKLKESDIALAAMQYLQSMQWDCYPEAQFNAYDKRADIAATRDGLLYIVEAKVSFSWQLFEQALGWVNKAHYVSVAVPSSSIPSQRITDLCREKGIGIIGVYTRMLPMEADVYSSPPLHRSAHRVAKKLIAKLHPDMKQFTPGTTGSFSTPYTRTMKEIQGFIKRNPGCGLKDIMNNCTHHYQSDSSARTAIPKWIRHNGYARVEIEGRTLRFYPN